MIILIFTSGGMYIQKPLIKVSIKDFETGKELILNKSINKGLSHPSTTLSIELFDLNKTKYEEILRIFNGKEGHLYIISENGRTKGEYKFSKIETNVHKRYVQITMEKKRLS